MSKIFADNDVPFANEEFYISYTKERTEFAKALDEICYLGGRPKPQDRDETALVSKHNDRPEFYILYGDHRESYMQLVPDYAACLQYFEANLDKIGHSSDVPFKEKQS